MSEVDLVYPENVKCWKDLGQDGVIHTRLLVGQTLGARASGVVVKTRKLLHQLSLDLWQLLAMQILNLQWLSMLSAFRAF